MNSSNQLTATASATYTYDNNGNTLTKTDASGTTTYTWDHENRLTSVALPGGGGAVSFKYDPFGRRIQKSSPAGTINYVYDGANIFAEYDAAGTLQASYVQGAGIDQPLSLTRAAATSYYHADGLGSITSLTNSVGSIVATYSTDTFGRPLASTGTVVNPFRYTGREWDSEIGAYYYRARYYDAANGRFRSEDPIRFNAGVNFYTYVTNSPANATDPTGTSALPIPIPGPIAFPAVCYSSPVAYLVCLDVGLAAWDAYQVYRLGVAYDWWKPIDAQLNITPSQGRPKAQCDKDDGGDDDCAKQWQDARRMCRELLSQPNPPRALTGGYADVESCARGFVSEECGGNPIDYGTPKPRGKSK